MPTYQYKCKLCDHRLEAVQSFSDAPLTECPVCDGDLRKVFSSIGVVFKGSGFYRTDSRVASANGKSDAAAAKAESSAKATSDGKADSRSDGTSERKSDGTSERKSDGKSAAKSDSTPASKAVPSTTSKSA